MRYSHQRELILAAVKGVKTHPTADAVYDGLRGDNPTLSLGTVYRNLGQLAECGEITPIYTGDGRVHYDGDTSPHCHFVCRGCHGIFDIFTVPTLPEGLLAELGLEVESGTTIYYGRCAECRAETQNA